MTRRCVTASGGGRVTSSGRSRPRACSRAPTPLACSNPPTGIPPTVRRRRHSCPAHPPARAQVYDGRCARRRLHFPSVAGCACVLASECTCGTHRPVDAAHAGVRTSQASRPKPTAALGGASAAQGGTTLLEQLATLAVASSAASPRAPASAAPPRQGRPEDEAVAGRKRRRESTARAMEAQPARVVTGPGGGSASLATAVAGDSEEAPTSASPRPSKRALVVATRAATRSVTTAVSGRGVARPAAAAHVPVSGLQSPAADLRSPAETGADALGSPAAAVAAWRQLHARTSAAPPATGDGAQPTVGLGLMQDTLMASMPQEGSPAAATRLGASLWSPPGRTSLAHLAAACTTLSTRSGGSDGTAGLSSAHRRPDTGGDGHTLPPPPRTRLTRSALNRGTALAPAGSTMMSRWDEGIGLGWPTVNAAEGTLAGTNSFSAAGRGAGEPGGATGTCVHERTANAAISAPALPSQREVVPPRLHVSSWAGASSALTVAPRIGSGDGGSGIEQRWALLAVCSGSDGSLEAHDSRPAPTGPAATVERALGPHGIGWLRQPKGGALTPAAIVAEVDTRLCTTTQVPSTFMGAADPRPSVRTLWPLSGPYRLEWQWLRASMERSEPALDSARRRLAVPGGGSSVTSKITITIGQLVDGTASDPASGSTGIASSPPPRSRAAAGGVATEAVWRETLVRTALSSAALRAGAVPPPTGSRRHASLLSGMPRGRRLPAGGRVKAAGGVPAPVRAPSAVAAKRRGALASALPHEAAGSVAVCDAGVPSPAVADHGIAAVSAVGVGAGAAGRLTRQRPIRSAWLTRRSLPPDSATTSKPSMPTAASLPSGVIVAPAAVELAGLETPNINSASDAGHRLWGSRLSHMDADGKAVGAVAAELLHLEEDGRGAAAATIELHECARGVGTADPGVGRVEDADVAAMSHMPSPSSAAMLYGSNDGDDLTPQLALLAAASAVGRSRLVAMPEADMDVDDAFARATAPGSSDATSATPWANDAATLSRYGIGSSLSVFQSRLPSQLLSGGPHVSSGFTAAAAAAPPWSRLPSSLHVTAETVWPVELDESAAAMAVAAVAVAGVGKGAPVSPPPPELASLGLGVC